VSITGQQSFTQNPASALNIKSSAYLAACTGTGKVYTGMTYVWTVKKDGVAITSLTSTSSDPSSFRLAANTLAGNSLYEFTVTVTSSSSKSSSSKCVLVTTSSYALSAVIAGGSASKSIRLGDVSGITLDGSSSSDAGSSSTVLTYSWDCIQTAPFTSRTCPVTLSSTSTASAVVVTTDTAAVDDQYTFTLTVTDAATLRTASTSTVVAVTAADAPLVSVTSNTIKINPSSQLSLLGSVDLYASATATWDITSDDVCSDGTLSCVALTSVEKTLAAGTGVPMNLVIAANTFSGRVYPYVFSLTVGSSSSTVSIYVNMPPVVGTFSVSPNSGYNLDTTYVLSANNFADDDTPIRFEFGYLENGVFSTTTASSEVPHGETQLPTGDSSNSYRRTCVVRAYDTMSAMSSASAVVVVKSKSISSDSLSVKVSDAAGNTGYGNTDAALAVIAGAITYANTNGVGAGNRETADINSDTYDTIISAINTVSQYVPSSDENVVSIVSTLESVSSNPSQLTSSSASVLSTLATSTLSQASDLGLSYTSLSGVFSLVDSLNSFQQSSRRRLSESSSTVDTGALFDAIGELTASSMVYGQSDIVVTEDTFSFSAKKVAGGDKSFDVSDPSGSVALSVTGLSAFENSVGLYVASTSKDVASALVDAGEDQSTAVSNSVRIKLTSDNVANVDTISFVIPTDAAPADSIEGEEYKLFCVTGDETYTCPYVGSSEKALSASCDGHTDGYATVSCPSYTAGAKCQMLAGDSSYKCSVESSTATETTCVCSLTASARRRLASGDAVLEDSGALEVVAATTVVATEFKETLFTAGDLNSAADLKKVMIVLLLYATLWGVGLAGLAMCTLAEKRRLDSIKTNGAPIESLKAIAVEARTKESIRQYLTSYVNEVFPAVFRSESAWKRFWGEIKRHHRYILLFTAHGNESSKRILTGVHLMTVQSMLMFMLAVVYDIQFPTDDGTCATHLTEDVCLREQSPFGTTSMCRWDVSETTASGYGCYFVEPHFNFENVIIISIVVAVLTAPVNMIVDFLCIDILSAPTADQLKVDAQESIVKQTGRRMSAVARRASNVTIDAVNKLATKIDGKKRNSLVMQKHLMIPDATQTAHVLATSSVKDLLDDVKTHNQQFISTRGLQRSQSLHVEKVRNERRITINNASTIGDIVNQDGVLTSNTNAIVESRGLTARVESAFMELTVDIKDQRRKLRPFEQEDFDAKWGVDPTGEFSQQNNGLFCCSFRKNAKQIIMNEIRSTIVESDAKIDKLRLATSMQIGLEILHLFVLDILGKTTSAAKIFTAKSSEDFRHSVVVTRLAKRGAMVALVLVNFFFVYFSILRGLQRGKEWQMVYLTACLMQIAIEILFYETTECAIVHFIIPSLVLDEINNASDALHKAVQKICASLYSEQDKTIVLDAPQYLYVSTNVAKKYPDLMESVIVQSYHSYLPGEIGSAWRIHHSGRSTSFIVRFTEAMSTSIFMQTLQRIGAMPGNIQRIIIHSIQPLLVSSFIILWMTMLREPYIAIPIGLFLLYVAYRVYRDAVNHRHVAGANQIMPVADGDELAKGKGKDTAAITPVNDKMNESDNEGTSTRPGSGNTRPGSGDSNIKEGDVDYEEGSVYDEEGTELVSQLRPVAIV